MANSSTLISTVEVPDKKIQVNRNIYTYKITIDGGSDLTVVAADPDNYIGLVGWHGIPAGANNLVVKTGSTLLALFAFGANQGLDYRLGPPLLWTNKNEALVMSCSAVHDSFIAEIVKWSSEMPVL